MQHHQIILATIAILASSGFLLGHSSFSKSVSDPSSATSSSSSNIIDQNSRSLRLLSSAISQYIDPKSITPRPDGFADPLFVVPEAHLADSKYAEPTIVHSRPTDSDHQGVVVDVLSIGSETRPEYLTAQINTWASHVNVRHFWGVTERQDYDVNCDSMSKEALQSFVQTCKGPMGWDENVERFRAQHLGEASGFKTHNAGWFCAQRRPGHALGWLQAMYQNETMIPDILLIVDDDTSMDIEKMKHQMLQGKRMDGPFVGSSCYIGYYKIGFHFAFGGFGTFFNRASIQRMTQPIFCDERQGESEFTKSACANLQKNQIGELDVFQQGDSVFELFYKYSAIQHFCLHSDWAMGYMITYYSGGELHQLQPRKCRRPPCSSGSITCHNQSPKKMEEFVLAHS
mmetsp:Transcript_44144/g.79182  ORF Transcript_44144/g.79182 Transcript_44144/m.79182 type:complete len:400 (-) Transcript_44144:171-1370(-)